MYLAINYSPPASHLVKTADIDVDFFKTPDWDWMVEEARQLRPVAVHFNLEAGNPGLDKVDWSRVEQLAQATKTPFINLHIDARQKHFPKLAVNTTEKTDRKKVFKAILSDVSTVMNIFGPNRVIVENSPYRAEAGNTLRPCIEPDLISHLIHETGCGLLLDISHAIIASRYIGMPVDEYLNRLPTGNLKEMHFAGIHKIKGDWIDHQSILKKDWKWLDWVFSRIASGVWNHPWLMAFEYGGVGRIFEWRCDPQVISEQVPMLYERVRKLNLKLS